MAIHVSCVCGKHFEAGDQHAGKQTRCPGCGRPLLIPGPAAPAGGPARRDDEDEGGTYAVNAEDAALPMRLRNETGDSAGVVGEIGQFRVSKSGRRVHLMVFAADNRHALAGVANDLCLVHAKNGEVLYRFKKHVEPVLCAAFSPDGQLALSAEDAGGRICLWDVDDGKEIDWLKGHRGPVWGVAFSPSGRYALSGGEDGTLRLWDVRDGTELDRFEGRTPGPVQCVGFSADGRLGLAGGSGGAVRVWDLKSGQPLGPFRGANGTITTAVLTPDGTGLVAARCTGAAMMARRAGLSFEKTGLSVWKWDLRSGRAQACFENPSRSEAFASCVALRRDGQQLVTAGEIKKAPDDRPMPGDYNPTNDPVVDMLGAAGHGYQAFRAIKDIVTAHNRQGVQTWNVSTGQLVKTSAADSKPLSCLAVSPDGRTAATGTVDGLVRVWGLPL
jgi:hypothetical protein